ncbi:MAG: hypothetical protein IT458_06780 [Planctomycetes bacterium]|nr:hypothetical protein [Planctomycetota bacterium]
MHDTQACIAELLRKLVALLSGSEIRCAFDNHTGIAWQVLLDVEAHGWRWIATRPAAEAGEPSATLSPRELEIARLISKGHCNKTVAAVLEISTWTVATYMRRVFAKLHVGTRSAMIARLMEQGMLIQSPVLGGGAGGIAAAEGAPRGHRPGRDRGAAHSP